MSKVELGGSGRVGSGDKISVNLHNYGRSTHDLSYTLKTTQAPGTLVPFMNEIGLNGDTWNIELFAETLTHPTLGPLFDSFKQQMDVYVCPIKNYQGLLKLDATEVGMNMSKIKIPQIELEGRRLDLTKNFDNQHTDPSCILAYFGIRGLGFNRNDAGAVSIKRRFSALELLAYWDIYKTYYANKQEKIGAVISSTPAAITAEIDTDTGIEVQWQGGNLSTIKNPPAPAVGFYPTPDSTAEIVFSEYQETLEPSRIFIETEQWGNIAMSEIWINLYKKAEEGRFIFSDVTPKWQSKAITAKGYFIDREPEINVEPQVMNFDLKNIDEMRINILRYTEDTSVFMVDKNSIPPYNVPFQNTVRDGQLEWVGALSSQQGLGLKTYQSDIFNNWLDTEWISGDNGINQLTAIDTTGGSITIDEINMANKVFNILNRVAVSGGTYYDWQAAVWGDKPTMRADNPMYMGGLSKEIVFQEVISTASSENETQPLGTLAGRGKFSGKHKGGKITIKVTEPSIIMGINSITPRIVYSQGNKWSANLKTMDDFHKPGLDGIGFQDLITDKMAYWSTAVSADGEGDADIQFYSAGKQPAWLDYQTSFDRALGGFAKENEQMFMTLNRRYEAFRNVEGDIKIKDLTTYIDPAKYNYIFADVRRDAQNFWVQIGVKATVRRKMSANQIPNL